jgi:hypothetical protein
MNPVAKRTLLAAGLLLTLAATGWVASQDEPKKPATAERGAAKARRAAPAPNTADAEPVVELRLDHLRRPDFSEASAELFPSRDWQPPPPPPAPAAAPEPPRAPPLPFAYFGQMAEEGKAVAFLSRGNVNYPVRQGETLEGSYRVDEIRRDAIVLTYLPLQQQQTLATGSAK